MRNLFSIFNFPPAIAFAKRWRAGQFAIKKGFTLIELLVAIAILGVLTAAAAMIINPAAQFQKGNDARRKADLAQVQKALETYYQDNGAYPSSSADYQIAPGGTVINWGEEWETYMGNLPKDPNSSKNYAYFVPGAFNGQTYYLYASLDRSIDSQTCGGGIACGSVPAGTPCGSGNICNYGVSSPDVNIAMAVPTLPSLLPTSSPTPTPTPTLTPTPTPTSTPTPTPSPTPTPITNGLIGWWKMNGNPNDSSTSAYNGTVNGIVSLTADKNGNADSAYSFPGTATNYINMGAALVVVNGDTRSFSFWIYDRGQNSSGFILGKSNGCGNYGQYTLSNSSGGMTFAFLDSVPATNAYIGPASELNFWNHYVITYTFGTGTSMKMYKNGVLVSGSWSGTGGDGSVTSIYIGDFNLGRFGACATNQYFFFGKLDDVRIYNRALSTGEVSSTYISGPQ